MNEITTFSGDAGKVDLQAIERASAAIAHHADVGTPIALSSIGEPDVRESIAYAQAWLQSADYRACRDAIERAASRAPELLVREQLTMLVWSFPHGGTETSARMLAMSVLKRSPTVYGIMAACERQAETREFVSTIAAMLPELEAAETRIAGIVNQLRELPEHVARAVKALDAWLVRERAEAERIAREQRPALTYQADDGTTFEW